MNMICSSVKHTGILLVENNYRLISPFDPYFYCTSLQYGITIITAVIFSLEPTQKCSWWFEMTKKTNERKSIFSHVTHLKMLMFNFQIQILRLFSFSFCVVFPPTSTGKSFCFIIISYCTSNCYLFYRSSSYSFANEIFHD